MIALYNRVIAWIFSILVMVLPFMQKYSPALDVDKSVASVIAAIKTKDISTIESFMCKNIKDNVPNLRTEIGNLIDLIEGTITSVSSKSSKDFYGSTGGKKIELAISNSILNTTVTTFYLDIRWEVYNNFAFEERGIRYIQLFIKPGSEYELLTEIRASD